MQFQFNAGSVEPSGGREIWPAGEYPLVITSHDIKPANTGGGTRMTFGVECIDGPFKGKKNIIGLNIQHPNQQTVEIAYKQLSAICHVTGKFNIQDLGELHGIPFRAVATISEKGNNWDAFKDTAGNDALTIHKRGGTGAQQQPGGSPGWQGGGQQQPNPGWQGGAPQQQPGQGPQQGWQPQPQAGPTWGPGQQQLPPLPGYGSPAGQGQGGGAGGSAGPGWQGGAPAPQQPPAGGGWQGGGAPQSGGWQPGAAAPGGQPGWAR